MALKAIDLKIGPDLGEELQQIKASVNNLMGLTGESDPHLLKGGTTKNGSSSSKVKEEPSQASPAGSRICAGVKIVTGIPYSSRRIGALNATSDFSSEEESEDASSEEEYRHINMARKHDRDKGRSPPIDLAFGDPIKVHGGFNDKSIYPWSIEGQNPEQISRMLSMMIAASNAYIHGKTRQKQHTT